MSTAHPYVPPKPLELVLTPYFGGRPAPAVDQIPVPVTIESNDTGWQAWDEAAGDTVWCPHEDVV